MGEGAREKRERERGKEEEGEEEGEEAVEEEVEDIFRAAPNQLLRRFVSVGAREGEREKEKERAKGQRDLLLFASNGQSCFESEE